MTKTLHFTLGPVQNFVEQARRTRDLWAGSFLLSYLSGQAMKAVMDAGGEITFPFVGTKENPADALLAAILGKPLESDPTPQIGSLPNRFKARVPDDFEPKRCEQAVKDAWEKVADAVWYKYVFHVAEHGQDTQTIWNRQLKAFWDMAWVIGDSSDSKVDGTWLDQRKNWRTYQPIDEESYQPESPRGYEHCTLMGNWAEISGWLKKEKSGVSDEDNKPKSKQQVFWEKLKSHRDISTLELGEHERLSAVALIKRLYPKVAKTAIGWDLKVKNWPSTPYMAAVPWLETAHRTDEAKKYLQVVEDVRLEWASGEYNTGLTCLKDVGKFAELDGNFFHETALENKNAAPLRPELSELEDAALRRKLITELQKVNQAVGHPASPFYALLLMDGDSLGKLLREAGETEVSQALSRFTSQVDRTVQKHCGKTVYAGGDDVMALLPLDKALQAANELRGAYLEAFKSVPLPNGLQATISGAVVFARYNLSLRAVLKEAHHQLDEVAKAQNGRDSMAVSVFTGSGRTVQWVSKWQDSHGNSLTEQVTELSQNFERDYSSGFFYNLRERFAAFTDDQKRAIQGLPIEDLLKAEYLKSRERTTDEHKAKEMVGRLVSVCRERKNRVSTSDELDDRVLVDGALLVRFLAGKGRGIER